LDFLDQCGPSLELVWCHVSVTVPRATRDIYLPQKCGLLQKLGKKLRVIICKLSMTLERAFGSDVSVFSTSLCGS
jgi:hypothetical protein